MGNKNSGGGGGGAPPPQRKAPARPQASRAVQSVAKIKQTQERLEKRQKLLEKKIAAQIKQAKAKSKAGDKRGALMCLKRKKMYDKEIAKMQGVSMTLEQQIFNIEGAQTNVDTVNAMKEGKDALASMQGAVNVEQVEELREDIEEQQQRADEVGDILAEGMGAAAMMDEDDLLAELDGLEEEDAAAAMAAAPAAPLSMPAAPTGAIEAGRAAVEDDDEAELAALQAEFA